MASALLPLLMLAQAEPAPPPVHPAAAMLDLFEKSCREVGDYAAAGKAVRAAGWTSVPASAEPHLAKLVEIGMSAVPDGRKSGANFRRTLNGRTLYLILSRYEDGKSWANGCRLYDFEASAELPEPALEAWMKRPSSFRQAQPGVITKSTWQPGWNARITIEAAHVPRGSVLTDHTGLAGTVLVAQTTGRVAPATPN